MVTSHADSTLLNQGTGSIEPGQSTDLTSHLCAPGKVDRADGSGPEDKDYAPDKVGQAEELVSEEPVSEDPHQEFWEWLASTVSYLSVRNVC